MPCGALARNRADYVDSPAGRQIRPEAPGFKWYRAGLQPAGSKQQSMRRCRRFQELRGEGTSRALPRGN